MSYHYAYVLFVPELFYSLKKQTNKKQISANSCVFHIVDFILFFQQINLNEELHPYIWCLLIFNFILLFDFSSFHSQLEA